MALKQSVAYNLHSKSDVRLNLLRSFGCIEKNKKLTFKHTALNKKPPGGINHHNLIHVKYIQRSKYMCIDDNVDKDAVFRNH